MDPRRYLRLAELFEEARLLSGQARRDYLAHRCGTDRELLRDLECLLEADADPADLVGLVQGPGTGVGRHLEGMQRLGNYRILRCIGEGGMGVVYEAEQQNPHRLVALKVLGMDWRDAHARGRFRREAELLGTLSHPGIAQIFEAGVAKTKRGPVPFLAMERIYGESLLLYAGMRSLDTRNRVALFAKVCDAVDHAHQRGVVHRDLKPANILVSETTAGEPQPKVLDFGVARATGRGDQGTLETSFGQLIGTLQYMSPEQVSEPSASLDSRSDVYSLGVVLFELLTDRLPHDLEGLPLTEAVRIIREEEPTRVTTVDKSLRGDLDCIVTKALQKDRNARYLSAADMAGDLRRYLRNESVIARRPSALYQVVKFARRNRAVVSGVVLAFLGLSIALIISLENARGMRAQVRKEIALRGVLDRILESADPSPFRPSVIARGFGPNRTLGMVVRQLAEELRDGMSMEPGVEAEVDRRLGWAMFHAGYWTEAERMLERALTLQLELLGADHPHTLACKASLAWCKTFLGHLTSGQQLAREAVEGYERLGRPADPSALQALLAQGIGRGLLGDHAGRARIARDLMTRLTRLGEEVDFAPFAGRILLAEAHMFEGRLEEAEACLQTAMAEIQAAAGARHLSLAVCKFELALLAGLEGDLEQVRRLQHESIDLVAEIAGPDSDWTVQFRYPILFALLRSGHYGDAIAPLQEYTRLNSTRFGEGSQRTLQALDLLAQAFLGAGRREDFAATCRRWLEAFDGQDAGSRVETLPALVHHARFLQVSGASAEVAQLAGMLREAASSADASVDDELRAQLLDVVASLPPR